MNTVAFATTPVGLGAQLRVRNRVQARSAIPRPQLPARHAVIMAKNEEPQAETSWVKNKALGALLAGALMLSSAFPDEALAAKSAGRAGGRGGFSSRAQARRAPPPRTTSGTTNVTVVQTAPPIFGGFGGFGYGGMYASPFGGFGFFPVFGFGAGILQFMLLLFVLQVLFSFVTSMFSRGDDEPTNKKDKSDFDDF
uniref:Uncharacterized protein n=1 Tax=Pyramimonas obovata TaxID=1411642 RepID=A0A7S0R827_9CHLO